MLVPLSAGTTTDVIARQFAERVGQRLGQTIIVDNKPGAGGTLAAQLAAKAPADGYTILLVNSQHAINPASYPSLPYDTLRDLTGIALVAEAPSVIAVPRDLGVNTLAEFIALAKSKPGKLNYGSSGVGSQTHLSGAFFANRTGITMAHVPYKSGAEVISDLLTNRIQSVFVPAAFVNGQIQAGKVVALAVSGAERLPTLRDVPTTSEAGVRGIEFGTWFGFIAPAKTPPQVLNTLANAIKAVQQDPAERQKLTDQGITPRLMMLGEFDAYIKTEIDRLGPLVKAVASEK
ncbi:MAG TPA: tripartite tricarboxylate transporter substrate binding protein [Ramlibacter sp.]|nr:tripartite tricarboxylate transporter substrate binding protein [Ramlibacter sp.]